MISMFTAMARGLLRTPESIATPCSANACGRVRRPPWLELAIAFCDRKTPTSDVDSWNMKSEGNRSAFRRTCSIRRPVETP